MRLLVIALLLLAGCSSVPRKYLMKNCEETGKNSGLFYCEEIPKHDEFPRNDFPRHDVHIMKK